MMLPGLDMQAEVLRGRRGRYGMTPGTAEPFHAPPIVRIAGRIFQGVEDIVQTHIAQTVKQGAGIFQHHPRFLALMDELRDKFADPLVAPMKTGGIVIVANPLVIHHVLEVADHPRRLQVMAPGGNQRLVHVQGDRAGCTDSAEFNPAIGQEGRPVVTGAQGLVNQRFGAANIRQAIDVFRKLAHELQRMSS